LEKQLNFQAQYWAETAPRLQPTGRGGLPRAVSRKAGWATAWQPSPVGQTACAASCNACAPRVRRRGHHAQRACGMARWRARRRLGGGSMAARRCRRSRGGHWEGAGQGGEGRGAPKRRVDGEAAQTASGGGVQRRRGCSGGHRRAWRGPAAPVWKGKERFSSNSGNGEARRALTGEGGRRRRLNGVRHEGGAPVVESWRGGDRVGGEAYAALGCGRVRQTARGGEEFGRRVAGCPF
jgi:hypothetical protein